MTTGKRTLIALSAGTLALLPLIGFAQIETPVTITRLTTVGGFIALLGTVIGMFYTIFFIVAAIFIILAAFTYLTAAGDEEKVKSAKNRLIYAIVAIAVALLAVTIRGLVSNFLGT